jgi:CRP/FNR family transcriptional regulator, cyclic AMP receptor protein
MAAGNAFVRVLEEDPELAVGLDPTSVQLATRHAIAAVEIVAPGTWEPAFPADGGGGSLGLLVLDGLLMRDVAIAQATCTELIGRGDLLRPWDWERDVLTIKPVVTWTALQPVRLAVLDRRIAAVMGRWPELVSAIVARAVRRSFELATNQATSHMTRVDARLELLFWGLADRWGRVGPDGVVLDLPLTHQVLGRLVGAQRPSVTTALSDLSRRGVIERREDGAWVLRGDPPGDPLEAASGAAAAQQATPT